MSTETIWEALDHIRSLSLSVPMAHNDERGFYRSQLIDAIGTAQRAVDGVALSQGAAHEERGLDVDIAAALGYELRSDGASTQRALNEAGLAIVRLAATPEAAPDANSVEISGELAPAPTTEERDHA